MPRKVVDFIASLISFHGLPPMHPWLGLREPLHRLTVYVLSEPCRDEVAQCPADLFYRRTCRECRLSELSGRVAVSKAVPPAWGTAGFYFLFSNAIPRQYLRAGDTLCN